MNGDAGVGDDVASRIEVVEGDITELEVDAIVNAANSSLRGGGGVDGAIHRAAGPLLVRESAAPAPCPAGEARMTGGFDLPARHVIHTVGPVWYGGVSGEARLLRSCYTESLRLAQEAELCSVAFPGISTGVYRPPARPGLPGGRERRHRLAHGPRPAAAGRVLLLRGKRRGGVPAAPRPRGLSTPGGPRPWALFEGDGRLTGRECRATSPAGPAVAATRTAAPGASRCPSRLARPCCWRSLS